MSLCAKFHACVMKCTIITLRDCTIMDILLRFRLKEVVLISDIEKALFNKAFFCKVKVLC